MEMDSILTVVATLVGALTSAKAWEFWQRRSTSKAEEKKLEKEETHLYRDDLRKEVQRLRTELMAVYKKREKELEAMHKEIAELREQLATFKTRVEFLERENNELQLRLDTENKDKGDAT